MKLVAHARLKILWTLFREGSTPSRPTNGLVMELVDMLDSKSGVEGRVGSTPTEATKK